MIGTPQLLLLSGVGPSEHLHAVGIEVIAALPGVGANLHDHPKSIVTYAATRPVRSSAIARKPLVLFASNPSQPPDLQIIFANLPIQPRFTPGHQDGTRSSSP